MTYCYSIEFDDEVELDNDESVVAGVPARTTNGQDRILVESETPKDSGGGQYYCGDGGCQREVSGPNEVCWQHQDDES